MGTGASTAAAEATTAVGEAVLTVAKSEAPKLGVIRLDYNYPPAPGDIDHPGSYDYDVFYRVVPGLTFQMCQDNAMTPEVIVSFVDAIRYLDKEKGVSGITGDCGFMMWFQALARAACRKAIFMSSLVHLPAITCAYGKDELIAIFTANSATLAPMKNLIKDECGIDADEKRFVIVGCQDVPGFEAVAAGEKVDVAAVTPGMVAKAQKMMEEHPGIRCILMECTELPPYSDALRAATGLPVYDAITCADFFIDGYADNPRFGIDNWQHGWDGEQEDYTFGENLGVEDKMKVENAADVTVTADQGKPLQVAEIKGTVDALKNRSKASAASLGVVRLDYNYPPAPGDIDHPGSYQYDVYYRAVPGLTFAMCQSGELTEEVDAKFLEAVDYLEAKGVSGITGDCGFYMWFQAKAREHTKKATPVFMSALAQLPAVTAAFGQHEKIAVFTANSSTLTPMKGLIKDECGVDPDEERFVIVGCQDVPGFEAVELGEKVNVEAVTPGMIAKAQQVMKDHPTLRAILMECTELPPYSDAVRAATGLPVFDAITCCDLFINGKVDNPRFGINDWQHGWDGEQEAYTLGENLSANDAAKLETA